MVDVESGNNDQKKLYQVVICNIEGDKNIYSLKKILFESLGTDIESSQNMLSRGPYVIGKFDEVESEHWVNVLKKLNADVRLIDSDHCPLHPENKSSDLCSICKTNICQECRRKLGLKNICELCAVDFDADKQGKKSSKGPLFLIGLALILIALYFILRPSNENDQKPIPEKRVTSVTEKAEISPDLFEDTEIREGDLSAQLHEEETDEFGLIFDKDIDITDLGQIGFVVYRTIGGTKEPVEFFTEKDMSFNFSILLEIANMSHDFEVEFYGPDGGLIKTQRKTTQIGEKEAEFDLRRSEIKHKYENEFIFAAYFASIKMNNQVIGSIPLIYNPSEDFVKNNLPGVPHLNELSPSDFHRLGNEIQGPWVVIFYKRDSMLSMRLIQAARILSQNPGFLVKLFQMNFDRNKDIIEHFRITDVPATAILVGNRVINITYGFTNSDEFVQSISVALNRFYGN